MLQHTKPLEKLSNTAISLRGDDVIADVIKNAVYRQKRTLTKAFQKEKT